MPIIIFVILLLQNSYTCSHQLIIICHCLRLELLIVQTFQQFSMQWNPGNSNFEGKRKTVRVSGVSSYRGRLKYSIFQVNN